MGFMLATPRFCVLRALPSSPSHPLLLIETKERVRSLAACAHHRYVVRINRYAPLPVKRARPGREPRLLAAERDETRVKAQILERTAKHQAAKAVVTRIMLTVAQSPGAAGGPGRAPLARAGGGTGVRDLGGPVAAAAAGASAKGGAAAAIEPMDISSATSMEEGRPLL